MVKAFVNQAVPDLRHKSQEIGIAPESTSRRTKTQDVATRLAQYPEAFAETRDIEPRAH